MFQERGDNTHTGACTNTHGPSPRNASEPKRGSCKFTATESKWAEVSVRHNIRVFDKHSDTQDLLIDILGYAHTHTQLLRCCLPSHYCLCGCVCARFHRHRGAEQTIPHTTVYYTDSVSVSLVQK